MKISPQKFSSAVAAFKRGDYASALNAFRTLGKEGDTTAQYNLGVAYHEGLGIQKDDAEAVKWYRMAAERGHPRAQNNLGAAYSRRRISTRR